MSSSDLTLAIKATLEIYKECVINATRGLVQNWILLVGTVACLIVFSILLPVFGQFGRVGGFMLGLLFDALLALHYSWLSETVSKNKLRWRSLLEFDWGLFIAIISVSFILYIVWLVTFPFSQQPDARAAIIIVQLLIVFLFNAIPESIYIHRSESIAAFSLAASFTKENWIEWYLPFVILLLPWIWIGGHPVEVLLTISMLSPLMPGVIIILGLSELLPNSAAIIGYYGFLVVGVSLSTWFMLFRGFLFKELSSGSRRRRIYLAKQR